MCVHAIGIVCLVLHWLVGPSMKAHVSWEVSHTWEEWKDFYQFLQYQFYYKLDQLPSFPKSHVLLTTLLTEDRILCLNRFIVFVCIDSQIHSGITQRLSNYELL